MARERIVQGTLRNLIVAGLVAVAFPAAAQNGDLPRATETLRLSIEEWLREDAAYRAARGAAKTIPAEAEEHAGFVAGLRVRVLEECENVRRLGGEDSIRGFVCTPASGEARPPVRAGAVLTEEEKRAAVQARLNQLEGDIDDSLQKRQQDIRQKAGAASARAAAGGGMGAGGGGGVGAGAGAGAGAGTGTGSSASPGSTWGPPPPEGAGKSGSEGERSASSGSRQTGSSSSASTGGPARGQSPQRQAANDGGSDDDVVARQLREAAEKETDPVLKEKLWDEYRKYKEGKR